MFALPGRKDGYKITFPKEFLVPEIEQKYSDILLKKRSFYITPIDFLNETVQSIDILGISNATVQQQQHGTGKPFVHASAEYTDQQRHADTIDRSQEDSFMYGSSEYNYRAFSSPLSLTDHTLNVTFRHTIGYLNYFMLFENFWYQYTRDTYSSELIPHLYIDLFNENKVIYSRIQIDYPIINGIDMLSFDYTQPLATNESFKVEFKYSNLDYLFLDYDEYEENDY